MPQLAPSRGPRVWREMDQEALDNAYDQLVYAPNRDLVLERIRAASDRARAALGAPQRIAYGPSEHERLDLFRAPAPAGGAQAGAPIQIFVHGGAWRASNAAANAFIAESLNAAGAHSVLLDFINVDQAGGDLMVMHRQVSRAIAWTWRNARSFGGDPNRLYVMGHSSGAHLASCALSTGWREEDLPRDFCKGAFLTSGMYDLAPVRLSKRSAYVKFTDQMEQALSAMRHLDGLVMPLMLAHGTAETPEFQRQTKDFFTALTMAGKPAELIVAEGYNHFEIFETAGNPYGLLGRVILKQMGLRRD